MSLYVTSKLRWLASGGVLHMDSNTSRRANTAPPFFNAVRALKDNFAAGHVLLIQPLTQRKVCAFNESKANLLIYLEEWSNIMLTNSG